MSQEKVDKYKKEKANRKQALAKQKRNKKLKVLGLILGAVAGIAVIILSVKVLNGDFEPESTTQRVTLTEEEKQSIQAIFGTTTASDDKEDEESSTTKPADKEETESSEEATTEAK